jgi:predicted lipid-binding transport protein (Tim44 family)
VSRAEGGVDPEKQTSQVPLKGRVPTKTQHVAQSAGEGAAKVSHEPTAKTITEPASEKTPSQPQEGEGASTLLDTSIRQVIAVSASKKPAVFFNLARKFLATDEECDLSALEGAILTAVDAAHLLERSMIATIVRIQTSYVSVEPKRKQHPASMQKTTTSLSQVTQESTPSSVSSKVPAAVVSPGISSAASASTETLGEIQATTRPKKSIVSGGRAKGVPLRRARIVITVRRTEDYTKWLHETPYEAIVAGEEELGDD